MNYYAIRAIYTFEMARTLRTPLQSFASPVISTILTWPATFVFGVPGLVLLWLCRRRHRKDGMFR